MKCPECSKVFKYRDVPSEDRVNNLMSTSFNCPRCRIILTPDKRFQIINAISELIIVISLIIIWVKAMFVNPVLSGLSYGVIGTIGLIGLLLCYINFMKIKLLSNNE